MSAEQTSDEITSLRSALTDIANETIIQGMSPALFARSVLKMPMSHAVAPSKSQSLVERLRAEYPRTGAYAPEATCRHGIHPYDCRNGCAPPTFEAADEIERLTRELAAAKTDAQKAHTHAVDECKANDRLRAALERYVKHDDLCHLRLLHAHPVICTCGLDATLAPESEAKP
jgi:hypothetical protein